MIPVTVAKTVARKAKAVTKNSKTIMTKVKCD